MKFFLKPNIPVVFLVFISWLYIYNNQGWIQDFE